MSKAIAGAAMIAADLAIGVALFLQPELLGLLAAGPMGINLLNGVIMGLFAGGVSMEAGALAQALTSNRGENISVRTPAGLRQICYGMGRLGGNIIYQSTTGAGGASGNYVYNYVIILATHQIDAFINLYLDGRQVFWRQDGNPANIGCGSVQHNGLPVLTCTVTIAGGTVTAIGVSGSPSGYGNVKAGRYRVRIWGGDGSGAAAYATNSGTGSIPVFTVHVTAGGSGYTVAPWAEVQGAYTFGGFAAADEQDPVKPGYGTGHGIAPSGEHYNFSGKVFCEARFGDQPETDSMTSLSANDSVWPSTASVAGCAYLYLNLGYDAQLFPSPPEIRVTLNGKNTIFDPRTGRTTVTANWALQVADVLIDPEWGLGDSSGNASVLVNGDFSQGATGWIFQPGWSLGFGGTPAGPGDAGQFDGPGTAAIINTARINCLAGYPVTVSCWSLGEVGATGTAVLRLTFYDSSDAIIGATHTGNPTPNTFVWTASNVSMAAPAGSAYATADFAVLGGGAGPRWFVWGMAAHVPNSGAVNAAQLIAAANVCDELAPTASQGAETRYAQHIHYDTSTGPGDALQMMMPSAAGRLGRIGGEWYIWPAYWQGPSYAFDQGHLIDAPTWTPYRSFKELFNRVNGTYIAPNYPYNVAGNFYDANGWYYGTRDNVWPFAWEPTNYPQYAADVLHGYAADQFLEEDGGAPLPRELSFRGVISIVQAQRVAKIALMRNRMQGSGSFKMGLEAWQVQPVDVIQFSWPILGMSSHLLEVSGVDFTVEAIQKQGDDENPALALSVTVAVVETDPTVYQWSVVEELTPYDVPAEARQIPVIPAAPTVFTVTSSAGTAVVGADGIVIPRARLDWNAPLDISVTMIQMQYQAAGASAWIEAGSVDVGLFYALVAGVVAGQTYNFRIRSIRVPGVWSEWVEVDGAVISMTLSNTTGIGYTVAPPGTLTAQALSDGTAQITVNSFTATWGGLSVFCSPSPYLLTGLNQVQLYYVYYIDPAFAGGLITPIPTGNAADFANKVGYFLIGSITTPSYTPRYQPSTFSDVGSNVTSNPSAAYDNDITTDAIVQGTLWSVYQPAVPIWARYTASGDCIWGGFPAITTTAAMTLHVLCSASVLAGTSANLQVIAHVGGTPTTLHVFSGSASEGDFTLAIPSGTALNTISVEGLASISAPSPGSSDLSQWAQLLGFEIYIQ